MMTAPIGAFEFEVDMWGREEEDGLSVRVCLLR